MGKQQQTHTFGFSVFSMFDSHPDCLLFGFSFISSQFCDLRFPISIFRFLTLSKFMFQLLICRFVYFRFQNFDFRLPVFGLRRFDTFTTRVSFWVFSVFRFHIYSFLIFDVQFSNFRCPQRNARRGALLPKKQTEPAQTNPKPSGLILSVTARGYFLPKWLNSFKPTFSRL